MNFKTIPTTTAILVLNIVVFLLQLVSSEFTRLVSLNPFGSDNFYWFQYVTACFAHGGFLHIFLNMLVLFSFAPTIEKKYGSFRFLSLYLTIGIISNIIWHFFDGGVALGASGCIYGLISIYTILYPNAEFMIIFLPFWRFKAKYIFPILLLIEVIMSIIVIDSPIGHIVHISGAVIGVLYYLIFLKR